MQPSSESPKRTVLPYGIPAYVHGNENSIAAVRRAAPYLNARRAAIIDILSEGPRGCSEWHVEDWPGAVSDLKQVPHSTVSADLNALWKDGWIVRMGKRKTPGGGIESIQHLSPIARAGRGLPPLPSWSGAKWGDEPRGPGEVVYPEPRMPQPPKPPPPDAPPPVPPSQPLWTCVKCGNLPQTPVTPTLEPRLGRATCTGCGKGALFRRVGE